MTKIYHGTHRECAWHPIRNVGSSGRRTTDQACLCRRIPHDKMGAPRSENNKPKKINKTKAKVSSTQKSNGINNAPANVN